MTEIDLLQKIVRLLEESKPAPDIMDVRQAADYMGVSVNKVWELKGAYKIPFSRPTPGRVVFRKEDLRKLVADRMVLNAEDDRRLMDGRRNRPKEAA